MASSPEDVAGDGDAVVAMAPLERLARERLAAGVQGARVGVRGQFVRRRKLSKGLVFSDIRLQDGELLEVMIRAQEGVLDFDAIRQINWDVHLGDTVTAHGVLQRKQQHHTQQDPAVVGEEDQPILFLLVLHSIRVDKRWSDHNSGAFLDHPTQVDKPSDVTEASSLGSLTLAPSSRAVATTGEPSERAQSAPKYTNMVVIDGFNACKYYFSGAGGVNCRRGAQCHFWHGDPADFALNRQRWLEARTAQRAAASRIAGDDEVDPHSKAGKAHRARILCDWLIENLGESKLRAGEGVLDIAGGKGDIPIELWNLRGIPTTLIDPRPMKLSKRSRRIIQESKRDYGRDVCAQLMCCLDAEAIAANASFLRNCSLFVGMHPDEATEAIVDTALELRIPFAIVPCCVMSRTFPDRLGPDGNRVETYEAFVEYLAAKHPHIQKAFLPFAGRNQVLYLFAYDQ